MQEQSKQQSQSSPLSEADARSLDDYFSSKPPFSPNELQAMVKEFRRMREKWQIEEAENVTKRKAKKAQKNEPGRVIGNLWEE